MAIYYENGDGSLIISYRKSLSHHMPANHFHSTYEIYYLLSGKRAFFIKDRTIVVNEGDIVMIAPNVLHRTTNAEQPEHERLVINIHESRMALGDAWYKQVLGPLLEQDYTIIKSTPQDLLSMEPLVQELLREIQQRKSGFELFAHTFVLQLLILCARHLQQHSTKPLESPSPMHERISEVVRYINTHYAQKLTLDLLAERFYVSPYYLSRFFKEATGFTFVEYVNSVRIKEAKKLLEGSDLKVNQISKKVGFGSVTHFGRVFKSVTGYAPLYYRRGK